MKNRIIILGHRGYRAKYPENSILSAKKALEYGAVGLEFDVQKAKDGSFVVIHDETVDRTAVNKKKGFVSEKSLSALKTVDLGNEQKIPELAEFLHALDKNAIANIELKEETIMPADCPALFSRIIDNIDLDRLIVSSFNHDLLPYFAKRQVKTGMLIGFEHVNLGAIGILKRIIKLRPDYLNLNIKMFEYLGQLKSIIIIALIRLFRCKIVFWTVNTDEELENALRYGDIIITDKVEYIVNKVKDKKS